MMDKINEMERNDEESDDDHLHIHRLNREQFRK